MTCLLIEAILRSTVLPIFCKFCEIEEIYRAIAIRPRLRIPSGKLELRIKNLETLWPDAFLLKQEQRLSIKGKKASSS